MLSIKIPNSSMANDAFLHGNKRDETIRIMRVILDQMEWGLSAAKIIDINGNTVGEWKLT